MSKSKALKIAVIDCETDPFAEQRKPAPFVWGFESVDIPFCSFWSNTDSSARFYDRGISESTDALVDFLYTLKEPYCIYAHNGGKFDFMFLLPHIYGDVKIVNGRILEARIGPHIIRDSYAAIPIPLGAYKKDDMDYTKMEPTCRNRYKKYITKYLHGDCKYLLEMMVAYRDEFGNVLTIGTAAMRALKEFHTFDEFDSKKDELFRQFYYGGRNQCFEVGEVKGDFKVYDENSAYPYVMQSFKHPVSAVYTESRELTDDTDFIIVTGKNYGALPLKTQFGLDFTAPYGTFYTTGHELRAGLETGTFEIERIENAYTFAEHTTFAEFVDTYYSKRMAARADGLDLYVLFYKLILNSGYGKFCLNSDNFKDWFLTEIGDYNLPDDPSAWTLEVEQGDYALWSRHTAQVKYFNVATGASITGAARAQLLRGLSKATRPVYCDTDSIICEALDVDADAKRLGAWKHEASGDTIYIAGKKLYALYNGGEVVTDEKGKPKQASKGARLTADQIKRASLGETIRYNNPVPAFKMDGNHMFINRNIRRTANNVKPFGAR
jgi:hypothetical protein